MAKLSTKRQIKNFTASLERAIKGTVKVVHQKRLAKLLIAQIQKRTRAGIGVAKTGQRLGASKRLRKLKPKTIEARRKKKLDGTTTPGKSNLTETGQMLRSLVAVNFSARGFEIRPDRRKRKGGMTNEELAAIHDAGVYGKSKQKRPRRFIGMTLNDQRLLLRAFRKTFTDAIKRNLT